MFTDVPEVQLRWQMSLNQMHNWKCCPSLSELNREHVLPNWQFLKFTVNIVTLDKQNVNVYCTLQSWQMSLNQMHNCKDSPRPSELNREHDLSIWQSNVFNVFSESSDFCHWFRIVNFVVFSIKWAQPGTWFAHLTIKQIWNLLSQKSKCFAI